MKDALARARSLYKRNNFRLALEILESNAASIQKVAKADQVQIFDLLAALYEKQGSLAKAQSYAVQIIRTDPSDLRGYLRLGKILQLSPDKVDQAIRVYERALKKAHFKNTEQRNFIDRQLMVCRYRMQSSSKNRVDTAAGLNGPKVDPVMVLPVEILSYIFVQLKTRELIKACQVSKRWREFIESCPQLWSHIDILPSHPPSTALKTPSNKSPAITPTTSVKYINMSRCSLHLNLQEAVVRTPDSSFKASGRGNVNYRLTALCFDNLTNPSANQATVKMLRSMEVPFKALKVLRITSTSPSKDIHWCVTQLPALENLNIVTTSQVQPSRPVLKSDVSCSNLRVLCVSNRSAAACLRDFVLADIIAQLPELEFVDSYRVARHYWPTLFPLFANTKLQKFGFSGDIGVDEGLIMPLPNFSSPHLSESTLNHVRVAHHAPAFIMPTTGITERWYGGRPGLQAQIRYSEFKNVAFTDTNLYELIDEWGCAESLEILVIHSVVQTHQPAAHENLELKSSHTVQYTNMGTLNNETLNWIIKHCPRLRKSNLEGTSITGPQLVSLLTSLPTVMAVKCPTLIDASADTIRWLSSLAGRNIIFASST